MCGWLSVLAQERRCKFWSHAIEVAELPHLSDIFISSGEEWACQCPFLGQLQLPADVIVKAAHSSCDKDAGDKLDLS